MRQREKRFEGLLGKHYRLFTLACPHYHTLQYLVKNEIRNFAKNKKQERIKVCEIGPGIGYTTKAILESDPRVHLLSIDDEKVMIEQARTYVGKGGKRVEFVLKDGLAFLKTLESGSIDVFASVFTLHNWTESYRDQVITEVFRVLKSGGIFVNADKYAHPDPRKHEKQLTLQLKQLNIFEEINIPQLKSAWVQHYLEDNQPGVIMKEDRAVQQMKEVGFAAVDVFSRINMEAVLVAKKGI